MKFYRYDASSTGILGCVSLDLKVFDLEKETPEGYWISLSTNGSSLSKYFNTKPRWISKRSRKRYAYPTREEALRSFILRKKAQVRIVSNQLHNAEQALSVAVDIEDEMNYRLQEKKRV